MSNAPTPTIHYRPLSLTAEHALRALLLLARRPPTRLVPAGEVAAALGTPPNYTAKTLRQLARRGLLRSVRGPRGGFALRAEPARISVARIVDALDASAERPAVCLLGDRPCDAARPCEAHRRWAEVQERTARFLESTTLVDLIGDAPLGSDQETTPEPTSADAVEDRKL
jgi:Rrf2 family protein